MSDSSFPNRVGVSPAKGVPGDPASFNPVVHAGRNYIAGDGNCAAGNFVWPDPAVEGRAVSSSAEDKAPLGLVLRNLTVPQYDLIKPGGLGLPKYSALTVVRRGDMYAVSAGSSAAGQKVFAKLADGGLICADAGSTVSGAVETNWLVTDGGPAGQLITISNWEA